MKKTAIAILIAVLVVAIGGALVFAGLSAVHYDFKRLDRTEYATNTYSVGTVHAIDIQGETADVELVAEGEADCKVVCFESDREKYAVDAVDGTLVIRPESSKARWSLFAFAFRSPKITIYLPAGAYELLKAQLETGDITADKALSFDRVEVGMETGDLVLNGVQARQIKAHGSNGDIRLADMAPETVDVSVSTGKIELVNVVCLHHINIVLWKIVHDFRKILVHSREDSNAYAEVRSPEESLTFLRTSLAHVITMILEPCSSAAYHLYASLPSLEVVAVSNCRICELNGNLCRSESLALEILKVVDINDTYYLMTTAEGNLLDHLTHLAVSD